MDTVLAGVGHHGPGLVARRMRPQGPVAWSEAEPMLGAQAPVWMVRRARAAQAPGVLANASAQGDEAREDAEACYRACLAHFRRGAAPSGWGAAFDDAGAAAAYLAARIILPAAPGVMTRATLRRIEQQLRERLAADAGWRGGGARARQIAFEAMAILGVLLHGHFMPGLTLPRQARSQICALAQEWFERSMRMAVQAWVIEADGLRALSAY